MLTKLRNVTLSTCGNSCESANRRALAPHPKQSRKYTTHWHRHHDDVIASGSTSCCLQSGAALPRPAGSRAKTCTPVVFSNFLPIIVLHKLLINCGVTGVLLISSYEIPKLAARLPQSAFVNIVSSHHKCLMSSYIAAPLPKLETPASRFGQAGFDGFGWGEATVLWRGDAFSCGRDRFVERKFTRGMVPTKFLNLILLNSLYVFWVCL